MGMTREARRRIGEDRSALIAAMHALEKAEHVALAASHGIIALVHLSHVPGVATGCKVLMDNHQQRLDHV